MNDCFSVASSFSQESELFCRSYDQPVLYRHVFFFFFVVHVSIHWYMRTCCSRHRLSTSIPPGSNMPLRDFHILIPLLALVAPTLQFENTKSPGFTPCGAVQATSLQTLSPCVMALNWQACRPSFHITRGIDTRKHTSA
jgi:hypothetical protein